MDVSSPSAAAAAISTDLRRLTKLVIEHLQDPRLLADHTLESSTENVLERLCASIRLAKPVGLAEWAVREGRRLGAACAGELAQAAVHVLAGEAGKVYADHGRLFALLEVLKAEVDSTLAGMVSDSESPRSAYSETAHALLSMLAERDAQTCCHSKATGEWARRLCVSMRIDAWQSEFVTLCAILHDIGKIATPDDILFKPGSLTAGEWDVMRDHAAAGQRILDQIPTLARCAPIVRSHHERWDGAGYPDRLSGERIPFEARVVAVADAFHAMISDRPYRKAIAPRRALEILSAGRGTQWDPLVVDAMLGLFGDARKASAPPADASSA